MASLAFLATLAIEMNLNSVVYRFISFFVILHWLNMCRRSLKNCPIPDCQSKLLVRLADHLRRVHDLSEIERKYWLQFAKIQPTKMVRVYEKETEPRTIFL